MIIERDTIILDTGRRIPANKGIVGLSPDGGIFGGYDDHIHVVSWEDEDELTPDELIDIAEHMIASWGKVLLDATNRKEFG